MKTSQHYLDMIGHCTQINSRGNYISRELKNIGANLSTRKIKTTHESLHEFLVNGSDIEELCENYKYDRDAVFNSPRIESNDLIYDVFDHLDEPIIAEARITEGFKAGLIDTINNAYMKTDRGWIDDEQAVILPNDASLEDVRSFLSEKIRIIPSLTAYDLENFENIGECNINGKLIAKKDEDGQWIDQDSNKKFDEGTLIRLLHHRRDPIAILAGLPAGNIYHATVTDSKLPEESHIMREGVCMQGDAVYGTSSVNEAVKIYGNPKSYEVGGRYLHEGEEGRLKKEKNIFGHLYQIHTQGSLYKASLKSKNLNFDEVPSPSVITLLAKENDTSLGFANNWWMMMKSSSSTYDLYMALNEFATTMYKNNPKGETGKNVLGKVLSSMGYQGLEIIFPSKEKVAEYRTKTEELKNIDKEEFLKFGVNRDVVAEELSNYLQRLEDAIPAKAEKSHLLVFRPELVEKKHVALLPLNKEILGKKDFFYSREEEISIDDIQAKTSEKRLEEFSM